MNVAPDTSALPPHDSATVPPALPATSGVTPSVRLPATKSVPAPPKRAAEQPAVEHSDQEEPAHAQPPQISPQLPPEVQANYERATNGDISVAEKNLQQADGKQLNAAQQDIVENIRNFLAKAREAIKAGDWARAQTLAHKARLLSTDLTNSL